MYLSWNSIKDIVRHYFYAIYFFDKNSRIILKQQFIIIFDVIIFF